MNIPEGKDREVFDSDYPTEGDHRKVRDKFKPMSSANFDELMSDDYKDEYFQDL